MEVRALASWRARKMQRFRKIVYRHGHQRRGKSQYQHLDDDVNAHGCVGACLLSALRRHEMILSPFSRSRVSSAQEETRRARSHPPGSPSQNVPKKELGSLNHCAVDYSTAIIVAGANTYRITRVHARRDPGVRAAVDRHARAPNRIKGRPRRPRRPRVGRSVRASVR